jgi:hypothetical protein
MGGNLLVMTEGGELDVWCKEAVGPWAGQRYHLGKFFVYWEVTHVLQPNSTRISVVSCHSGLDHCQEDEFVIVFTFDDTVNEPHPH